MTGPTDAGGLRSLVWNSKLQLWLHICLVNSSWNSWFPGESLCQSRQWSMLAPSAWMYWRAWDSKLQLWLHICLVNSSWDSWFPGESLCQSRQWSMLAPMPGCRGGIQSAFSDMDPE